MRPANVRHLPRPSPRQLRALPNPAAFGIHHSSLTPPPPAMKRLALILPLLALATAPARAEDPATNRSKLDFRISTNS